MNATDIWKELQGQIQPALPGTVRRRIAPNAPCDLFLALELPSELPMLVMAVPEALAKQLETGKWSLGVEAEKLPGKEGTTDVCLKLTDRRFMDVFGRLADDIIDAVIAKTTADDALQEFGSRFVRWQRFLERTNPDGLTLGAQMGLFGELTTLQTLMHRLALGAAVTAWVGPEGANQDFQMSRTAIEVKCTSTKLPLKIRVQSERQLDTTGLDSLFLMIMILDVREGEGSTLADLVAQVRQSLAPDVLAATTFENRLFQMGYLDDHEHRYRQRSFNPRQTHVCLVNDAFPRITGKQLAAGLGDVRYSIGVAECLPFEIDESVLDAMLEKLRD